MVVKSATKGRSRVSGCQNPEHRAPVIGTDGEPLLDGDGELVRFGLDTPCVRWANIGQDGRGVYRPPLARRVRAAVMHSMRHVILVVMIGLAFLVVTHVVIPKVKGYSHGTGGIFHNGQPSPQPGVSPVPTGHPKP